MAEPYLNDPGLMPGFQEPEPDFGPAKRKLLAIAFDEVEATRPMDRWQPKRNIAEDLSDETLREIGQRVVRNFGVDEGSRKDWLDRNREAIKLANQIRESKDWPWEKAANVKLPLIADASIKFASRAYAEIIRDDQVVKGKVVGKDEDGSKDQRAQRVGRYMSWQLVEKMEEWEEDTDKLLHMLSVVGHVFRKKYYSPTLKRCVSELCLPEKVCVNNAASSLKAARRVTHILDVHKNTVIEKQRAGIWLDVDLDPDPVEGEPDEEKYYCQLEQHCWLDLDGDDYEEPYIVTVHKDTEKVLGVVAGFEPEDVLENETGQIAQITRCLYFTDYKFIPSFDGGFYYVGFGALLYPGNQAANTIVNQLLDAGTRANTGGGFLSKEIKVKGGVYRFEAGEYKRTEATAEQLKNGFFPLPRPDPSPTLFNLLGLLLELTQDLASVKDVLAGDTPGQTNMQPTTVLALIEQGMKTFNAIYKRIYRSLSREFKLLYRLNYKYLDEKEYFRVLDEVMEVSRDDFEPESLDVVPVADPFLSTDVQRLARVESMVQDIPLGANPKPILRYKYETMRLEDSLIESILEQQDQGPNPEILKIQAHAQEESARLELKEREIDVREQEFDLKATRQEAEIVQILSQAIKNFADAEAAEAGQQMQEYQSRLKAMLDGVSLNQQDRQQRLAERKQAADEQKAQQAASASQPAQ